MEKCLQGLPGACARYLGVDAHYGAGMEPQLFDVDDPAAVTEWRLGWRPHLPERHHKLNLRELAICRPH